MRRSRSLDFFLAALAFICTTHGVAGVNAWTQHGPTGGGAFTSAVAIHPANADIVLTNSPKGIFRSSNGGQSWTLVKDDTLSTPQRLAFDPSNPNRVVASDGLIYVSQDAGASFALTHGPVPQNSVTRIAFGPDGTLYATLNDGRLFTSIAPFSTWAQITGTPWPANSYPLVLAVDPEDADIVYVGIESHGVYRSVNGGGNWIGPLNTGLPSSARYHHLAFDPADSTRMLLATGSGIYLSSTSGASWSQSAWGWTDWVGFDPGTPGSVAAMLSDGVALSTDNGSSWVEGARLDAPYLDQAAFAPGIPGRLLMTSGRGILISSDGGTTAAFSLSGLSGVFTRGLASSDDGTVLTGIFSGDADLFRRDGSEYAPLPPQALRAVIPGHGDIHAIAVAAGNSQQIFAIVSSAHLVRSFDGGTTWSSPHPSVSGSGGDYLVNVQIDPANAQVAYVARYESGLWKTTNAGHTFTPLDGLPPHVRVMGISPHDSARLYAVGGESGSGPSASGSIYMSNDGGANWTEQVSAGGNPFNSFSFDPTNPDIVYAARWGGVLRTTNGGATWNALDFSPSLNSHVLAVNVLVDPVIPSTLTVVGIESNAGILRSVDAGATWEVTPWATSPYTQFQSAVLDPNNPANLVISTSSASMVEYQISPDLVLAMSTTAATLPVSGNVTVTYTITNRGPHSSSASELAITVPLWLTPDVPANCALAGQTLRCEFGVIRVDGSISLPVTFAVAAEAAAGAQIAAVLSGHEVDVSAADNTVNHAVSSAELADVDVAISGTAQSVDPQQSTDVTVTVSNAGPSPSTATQLQLEFPANMTASNIVAARGTCTTSATTVTCSLGNLALNASTTVTLRLTGTSAGSGSVGASVQSAGTDIDNSHAATWNVQVRQPSSSGGGGGAGGGSSGGGGGGRLDLLLAGLLGLLVARHGRERPPA